MIFTLFLTEWNHAPHSISQTFRLTSCYGSLFKGWKNNLSVIWLSLIFGFPFVGCHALRITDMHYSWVKFYARCHSCRNSTHFHGLGAGTEMDCSRPWLGFKVTAVEAMISPIIAIWKGIAYIPGRAQRFITSSYFFVGTQRYITVEFFHNASMLLVTCYEKVLRSCTEEKRNKYRATDIVSS